VVLQCYAANDRIVDSQLVELPSDRSGRVPNVAATIHLASRLHELNPKACIHRRFMGYNDNSITA
jgi:hypothetical protein